MNNGKLEAAPQMYAGGDAKQAIEFVWPKGGKTNFISSEICKAQNVS